LEVLEIILQIVELDTQGLMLVELYLVMLEVMVFLTLVNHRVIGEVLLVLLVLVGMVALVVLSLMV
jgi:hypothetical protein